MTFKGYCQPQKCGTQSGLPYPENLHRPLTLGNQKPGVPPHTVRVTSLDIVGFFVRRASVLYDRIVGFRIISTPS